MNGFAERERGPFERTAAERRPDNTDAKSRPSPRSGGKRTVNPESGGRHRTDEDARVERANQTARAPYALLQRAREAAEAGDRVVAGRVADEPVGEPAPDDHGSGHQKSIPLRALMPRS